mgnify:CR=1 FL=1
MRLNILITFFLFLISHTAMAIEEPAYVSIEKKDAFEIREYQPKLIAQVLVNGTFDNASSKGFRLLADFIFGNNKTNDGAKKIEMTAPVVSRDASEKIEMTAPVLSEEVEKGWYISFNMPKQFTKETLPIPNNSEVKIIEMPAEKYAVIDKEQKEKSEMVVSATAYCDEVEKKLNSGEMGECTTEEEEEIKKKAKNKI